MTIYVQTLQCFTIGCSAQAKFGKGNYGGSTGSVMGSGTSVMMGIYISNLSGSHINPAVTIMFVVLGRTAWWKAPFFMLAQYAGAFVASACVYGVYLGKCMIDRLID